MFELPEMVTLARQINATLKGKIIREGTLGNSPHKFVWYNRSHAEFEAQTQGKTVGEAWAKGRWLFVALDPGYVLLLGECGGKVLYHAPQARLPEKYHLYLAFEDGSFFTATTQMWGAMELYEQGKQYDREYVRDMRPTPIEPAFTPEYFDALIESLLQGEKRSIKGLLTQDQIIPGLGNAIAQDIMLRACLHPRHAIDDLSQGQRRDLYEAILQTVQEVIEKGGRYDETDLYDRPGGYVRLMDKNSAGQPCTECGRAVEKMQYLGGACYFCANCQK